MTTATTEGTVVVSASSVVANKPIGRTGGRSAVITSKGRSFDVSPTKWLSCLRRSLNKRVRLCRASCRTAGKVYPFQAGRLVHPRPGLGFQRAVATHTASVERSTQRAGGKPRAIAALESIGDVGRALSPTSQPASSPRLFRGSTRVKAARVHLPIPGVGNFSASAAAAVSPKLCSARASLAADCRLQTRKQRQSVELAPTPALGRSFFLQLLCASAARERKLALARNSF